MTEASLKPNTPSSVAQSPTAIKGDTDGLSNRPANVTPMFAKKTALKIR